MINTDELGDVLRLGSIPDEELAGVLGGFFPLSGWQSENCVTYFNEQGHVLDLVYSKNGHVMRCEPGPELTDEIVAMLRKHTEVAFESDTGFDVRRTIMFSVPEVKGFWRHGDEWQILPAPPNAPRPDFQLGEHPLILEYRVRRSTNDAIAIMRSRRRYWELCLLFSLLLIDQITSGSDTLPHHWVMLPESTTGGVHTAYVNEGYMVGGDFTALTDHFSDPAEHPRLLVTPDDEYYARRGIREEGMDVPTCLDAAFNRFDNADARTRDKLLRASYWLDASYRVWDLSKSLSYIAAINAVEALVPKSKPDRCPCCALDRSPGPTARFRNFVETYAANEAPQKRTEMYRLRSILVHGDGLHNLDIPRAWGALSPDEIQHRELHKDALAVSRTAVRTWFLDSATVPNLP
jgi:hypothetical protein